MSGAQNPMSTDHEGGGFTVARFVTERLLAHVPDDEGVAASIATLAARAQMNHHHTRTHLRRLVSAGKVAETNNGGIVRYYQPQEGTMSNTEPAVTGDDVLAVLPRVEDVDEGTAVAAMTVREIAAALDVDQQIVAPAVTYHHRMSRVARLGKGGARDPFRYFVPAPEQGTTGAATRRGEPTSVPALDDNDGETDAAEGDQGVAPLVIVDEPNPGTMDDPITIGDRVNPTGETIVASYKIVIDDIQGRESMARADADTLAAVAVVLSRILEDGAR